MKHLLIATTVALSAFAGVNPAAAASSTLAPAPSSGIVLVEGGCGPGGFRDAYGYCRPRPVYAPRYCRPGWHITPYGCRPNY